MRQEQCLKMIAKGAKHTGSIVEAQQVGYAGRGVPAKSLSRAAWQQT